MRGLKSTIAAVVVLLALGGYIYFYEWDAVNDAAPEKEKAFAKVETESSEEVQIKAAGGETSRATKSGDGWQLVEPAKIDAEASEMSAVTSNLSSAPRRLASGSSSG